MLLLSCLLYVGELLTNPHLRKLIAVAQNQPSSRSATFFSKIDEGPIIRIDGSSSVASENQSVQQFLEAQDPKVQVELQYRGTDIALQALKKGKIDIAAIGRPLTDREKAEGLKAIALPRHKIAIVVGSKNPFQGNLNTWQFAKIFRGEITNWKEVGGRNQPIRFIDRPLTSDTRQNFKNYPVFRQAEFQTGSTVDRILEDSTEAVILKLGSDGIGYMLANQAINRSGLRIILMHNVPISDPRYPFSQPRYYVYKKLHNPAVQRFLKAAINLNLGIDRNSISWADNSLDSLTQEDRNNPSVNSLDKISNSPDSEVSSPSKIEILVWFLWLLLLFALLSLLWFLWQKYRSKLFSQVSTLKKTKHSRSSPIVTASGYRYDRLKVDNCFYHLNSEQISRLLSGSNKIQLEPGGYILKLDPSALRNSSRDSSFKSEPLALLWLYGGRFLNKKTNFEFEETWISLSGCNDLLTLEILEKTKLCGLFFNIPNRDLLELTPLSILKKKTSTITKNKIRSTSDSESLIFLTNNSSKRRRSGNLKLLTLSWHKVKFTPPFEKEKTVVVIPEVQADRENKIYRLSLRNITHQGFEISCDSIQVEQNIVWVAYRLDESTMIIGSPDSSLKTEKVAIVNIDATRNNQDKPIATFLPAGNYEVQVIGTHEGGKYDAWSRCNEIYKGDGNDKNNLTVWLNSYSISFNKFTHHIGTSDIFSEPNLALENAKNTLFTLRSNESVDFFIVDDKLANNYGGISLAVIKLSSPIEQQIGIIENVNPSQIYKDWYPVRFPKPFDYSQKVAVTLILQHHLELAPVLQIMNVTPEGFKLSFENILDFQDDYTIGWLAYACEQDFSPDSIVSNLLMSQINDFIINIDAATNNQDNAVVKTLPEGTYSVRVIGTDEGGKYDAWSRWSWVYGCDRNGENCMMGWENDYLIVSKEFSLNISSSSLYDRPSQALMKAQHTSFTLTSESEVYFFIYDDRLSDNRGGISLAITKISSSELRTSAQEKKLLA